MKEEPILLQVIHGGIQGLNRIVEREVIVLILRLVVEGALAEKVERKILETREDCGGVRRHFF